ncbi:anti-sigma factor domain-containing protein [Kribbella sp. NPDC004875]|uniref:anti-sigma factor n=1 Tax=Kribbella sp. NPDC004875 TaxID=3364107 RepID=UPI0036B7FFCA
MTTHLDEELLAQWVIDGDIPDDAATDHLRRCTPCSERLAELRAVASDLGNLPRLENPPSHVWDRVEAELGFRNAVQPVTAVPPTDGRRGKRPTRTAFAIAASVAAILGAGAGVAGTLLATSDDSPPTTEAVVRLEPLAGKSGAGNADLVRGTAGSQLRVTTTGLSKTPGFYEVWLINEDGKRMVSLGVLDPGTGGTFQVPAGLTGQGYRIVDISLEPDDGNPEHSHDSVVRGSLPG